MVFNEQYWFLRLLVVLFLHTSHCQEGNSEPVCSLSDGHFHCRNVKSFAFITHQLPSRPVTWFELADSPHVQLTSRDFNHEAFRNTSRVDILSCDVVTINPDPFTSLPKLTTLAIISNNLTEISSRSFAGLEHIEVVVLDDNQIASVAPDTFRNLYNLKNLYLSKNRLASIVKVFENQRNLLTLDLVRNRIRVLNDNSFKGLVLLRHLDLSYNRIQSISPRAFAELSELRGLKLGYNNLQSLSPELFQTNIRLLHLDLSGNNLANLANYPLNIPSLTDVHLNDCKIQSIPVDYFANLKNVSTLCLKRNELSRFEDVLVEALPRLSRLLLNYNKFTSFSRIAFRKLNPTFAAKVARYGGFRIANNPWNCEDPVGEDMIHLCQGGEIVF